MNAESLKAKIAEQLEQLPEQEIKTVLNFVEFLIYKVQTEPTTQIYSKLVEEKTVDSQLDFVGGVLVLKTAKEPVEQQVLETVLQDSREARIRQCWLEWLVLICQEVESTMH